MQWLSIFLIGMLLTLILIQNHQNYQKRVKSFVPIRIDETKKRHKASRKQNM